MHDFLAATKTFLNDLKDLIPTATFFILSLISAYQIIKFKLRHDGAAAPKRKSRSRQPNRGTLSNSITTP